MACDPQQATEAQRHRGVNISFFAVRGNPKAVVRLERRARYLAKRDLRSRDHRKWIKALCSLRTASLTERRGWSNELRKSAFSTATYGARSKMPHPAV